jgi:phosphatidate cytidylyltransferase
MSGSRSTLLAPFALLACLAVARWFSFTVAAWLMALVSFAGLREYLSLADLRAEDRWAMLAAYLAIPLQFWLVVVDWYGFFIVAVPVYVFVLLPFLVALGGSPRGSIFSMGALDLGLFLFVYCLAHLAYLARSAIGLALLLLLAAYLTDLLERFVRRAGGGPLLSYLAAAPPCFLLAMVIGLPAGLTRPQGLGLAALLPLLVLMGNFTLRAVESDLGIDPAQLEPGRGRIIDGLRPLLFAAPVGFHLIRYATELF